MTQAKTQSWNTCTSLVFALCALSIFTYGKNANALIDLKASKVPEYFPTWCKEHADECDHYLAKLIDDRKKYVVDDICISPADVDDAFTAHILDRIQSGKRLPGETRKTIVAIIKEDYPCTGAINDTSQNTL